MSNSPNNPKCIVFFTYHDFESHEITGGTRRLQELIDGFSNKGCRVIIISPPSSFISNNSNLEHYPLRYIKKSFLPLGLANFFLNFFRVRKLIKFLKYDRSVAIDVPYGIQMTLLGFKKICFIVWQDFIGYRYIDYQSRTQNKISKFIILKIFLFIERLVLKKSFRINVQCNYDLKILVSRHNHMSEELIRKTVVIPNNVNPSWVKKAQTPVREIKKNEPFIICFIGNLSDTRKGLHILLQAFITSDLIRNSCILRVVGDGTLADYYRNLYCEYTNIEFLGRLNNPFNILKKSSLLIVPSISDSFPNTILEALYLGVPVIGSSSGGIPEVLKNRDLIFETSTKSLAKKIEEILNPEIYKEINTICKGRAEELTFDWVEEMFKMVLSE